MRFLVMRSSQGAVSTEPPCPGAVRGPEAAAWPGEFPWFVDIDGLEGLIAFLNANGGGLGLFAPEDGEHYPTIEIYDDTDEDE